MSRTKPDLFSAASSLTFHNDTYPFISAERYADKLASKTALVTGAGRGIGRAIAMRLAAAGAHVVLVARRQADIDEVAREINSKYAGGSGNAKRATAIAADVSMPSAGVKVVDELHSQLGSSVNVDILVSAAGMTRFKTFEGEEDSLESWWRVMEVNLRGTISFIRAVLPGMRASGSGTIISVASTSGSLDIPFNTAYATSKAAVIKFMQDLSVELEGSGISCFSLHPGSVQTDLAAAEGSVDMESLKTNERMANVMGQFQGITMQTADLPAGTVVALCCDERAGRCLHGRYIDSQVDLGEVLTEAEKGEQSRIVQEKLYWLKMEEL